MSVVTGIVICASVMEDEHVNPDGGRVIHWIRDASQWISDNWLVGAGLVQLDDQMSCGKHPQMIVAGGGYNYFLNDEFLTFLKAYPWKEPSEVVIVFNPEEGPISVVRVGGTPSSG